MPAAEAPVPAWAPLASIGLAATGLFLSGYLSIEHITAPGTLACPAGTTLNCARVTTSDQSAFVGIPVAFLGVLFFGVMVVACAPAAWRSRRPAVGRGRLALAVVGAMFVVYLIYAELFLVDAICLWCTAVHIVAVALFAVVIWATAAAGGAQPATATRRRR